MSTTARRNDSPVIGSLSRNCYSGHMKMRRTLILMTIVVLASTQGAAGNDMARAWEAYDGGDYQTARSIWLAQAQDGDSEAMVALAGLAETGADGPADHAEARRLYRSAANLGNADAMQNLGVMLECGIGGPADGREAITWYLQAAKLGRTWADQQMQRLNDEASDSPTPCPN